MESSNRRYTVLSFFLFSALCGYVLYLALTAVADIFKFGGSNVIAGYPWPVVGGTIASILGATIFTILAVNQRALNFFDEVFNEVKKVTWPNSKETTRSTIVVVIMVIIAATALAFMDWIWQHVFTFIMGN